MVWEGLDAVKTGRAILGATNPLDSAPGTPRFAKIRVYELHTDLDPSRIGTIRGDFALAVGRNVCHGSDSVENAAKEINLYVLLSQTNDKKKTLMMNCFRRWFGNDGLVEYEHVNAKWVFE